MSRKKFYAKSFWFRILKTFRTIGKCLLLCISPIIIAALTSFGWYQWIFLNDVHFGKEFEEIITAAWIPEFGILYSLLVAIAINTVWMEYKSMRTAVKRYDLETFVDLVDEDLSPLLHTMVIVVSLAVLAGFLFLQYPNFWGGSILIFGVTFLLTLLYAMILEIDNPCSGLWYIKSIPDEWLQIDAKEYRRHRCEKVRATFIKMNGNGKILGVGVEKKTASHNAVKEKK